MWNGGNSDENCAEFVTTTHRLSVSRSDNYEGGIIIGVGIVVGVTIGVAIAVGIAVDRHCRIRLRRRCRRRFRCQNRCRHRRRRWLRCGSVGGEPQAVRHKVLLSFVRRGKIQ